MKQLFIFLFSFLFTNTYAQDVKPVSSTGNAVNATEAVRLFIDVLLKENQTYFEPYSTIAIYKNGKLMDNMDLKSRAYNSKDGGPIWFYNMIQPKFYNYFSSLICTDKANKAGCELNIKKLTFKMRNDLNGNEAHKVGDTLIIKTEVFGKVELTCIQFSKKGLPQNAIIYYEVAGGRRVRYGDIAFTYDKLNNLVRIEKTLYRSYYETPKVLSQTITTDYSAHGDRLKELRKEYQADQRVFAYETTFLYNKQFNLVQEKSKENNRPLTNYLIEYRKGEVEVFYATENGMKEYSYVYKLIK